MSPVFAALVFYFVFTPAALLLRLLRKDPLRLKPDLEAHTYWIAREVGAPDMRRAY